MSRFLILVVFAALAACAHRAPDAIRQAPAEDLSLAEVRRDPARHAGKRIRWGGTIAAVENRAQETWLDIVARPLRGDTRPQTTSDASEGRFIARVDGFLDPALYTKGREVTVAGTVEGTRTRTIGEYPYTYVAITAEAVKLWEQPPPRPAYYRDPFHDPFYDPFWPRRLYPWYAPYPFYPYWR